MWSAAVTPAMPLPTITTRSTSLAKLKPWTLLRLGAFGLSGVKETWTGPWTRAQQAIRVFGASPSRSSVARSSSEMPLRHSIPSLIATGSAPQMPIRQPDSIVIPLDSAISSSERPSLTATRLFSGTNVTSGAPERTARLRVSERLPAAPTPGAGAAACSRNGFSLRHVRSSQAVASAIAAARMPQAAASRPTILAANQ
jgi:hypothetical protein